MKDPSASEGAPPRPSIAPTAGFGPSLAALALSAAIVTAVILLRRDGADTPLFLAVNGWRVVPDAVWEILTVAGLGLTALVLGALLARGRPHALAALPWSFAVGGGLTHLVKKLHSMPRPGAVFDAAHVHLVGPRLLRNSMPSGHALTAFALVGILWLAGGPVFRRAAFVIPALALAVAISVSRVAVGAHFPADVVAGAVLGCATAVISVELARRTRTQLWLERPAGAWAVAVVQAGSGVALIVVPTGHPSAIPLQLVLGVLAVVVAARSVVARAGTRARPARTNLQVRSLGPPLPSPLPPLREGRGSRGPEAGA